jgi:hypothetical protein
MNTNIKSDMRPLNESLDSKVEKGCLLFYIVNQQSNKTKKKKKKKEKLIQGDRLGEMVQWLRALVLLARRPEFSPQHSRLAIYNLL